VYNDNSTDLLAGFDYKTFDDYELYWKYYDGNKWVIQAISLMM
jgi:hypothetical protein